MTATVYQVTIGTRVVRIELRREAQTLFARVDEGEERPVRLDPVGGTLWSLALGDARAELLAQRTPEGVLLALQGVGYRAEVLDEAHARLAQMVGRPGAQGGRRELKAPMPGLVVRVLQAPGDTLEPNQPLVVLQAMKMENELSLAWGGTLVSVAVAAGQTVEQGQVLAVVE